MWEFLIIFYILYYLCSTTENMENSLKQEIYKDLLRRAKEALDELKIPFFLSSGTCLGYYREGSFIDHDYDIDIGVFHEDYNNKIIDKFSEKGLNLYRVWGTIESGYELSFRLPNTSLGKHAKLDVFLHYKKDDKIRWITYMYKYKKIKKKTYRYNKKVIFEVPKFKLRKVNFMGLKVNVPSPTENYLENHYGPTWRQVIKSTREGGTYKYHTSPKSIVKK